MSTTIRVDTCYAYLQPAPADEEEVVGLVDDITSWKVPGAWHSPLYQNYLAKKRGQVPMGPVWDGRKHLLTARRLRLPAGLAYLARKKLWSEGFDAEIDDQRQYPEGGKVVRELTGVRLRSYQRDAVMAGLGKRHGIFSLPPATGKTELLIALVNSLSVFPVLWITHELHLLNQTRTRFIRRLGDRPEGDVGVAGGGAWNPKAITIAMVQTLAAKVKTPEGKRFLASVKVVISDEAHHEPAGTWYKLLMKCPAPYRFGCSATPLLRPDGSSLKLIGSVGPVIFTLTPKDAVAADVLSLPDIAFVDYDPDCGTEEGCFDLVNWAEVYRERLVHNTKRNKVILEICQKGVEDQRRILILIRQLAHGRLLYDDLVKWFESDSHVKFLQGSSFADVRQEVVDDFASGLVRVIIASSIFDEGVDIPEVDTVIIAAGGKSIIKAIQRVGRGMRKSDSKHKLEVFDFVDRGHATLMKHTRLRKKAYRSMGLGEVRTMKWKGDCK